MISKLVFTHLKGAKENQIEQIDLEGLSVVTIGRDAGSTIVIDSRDDQVGRHHAEIHVQREGESEPKFVLSDLDSRNGTFVNGERLRGKKELAPGDIIGLAPAGPQLGFDVYPRPAAAARTREMTLPAAAATRQMTTPQTTPLEPPGASANKPLPGSEPAKQGVGKETIERLLANERRAHGRNWMYSVAGVVVLIAAVGGGLFYYNHRQITNLPIPAPYVPPPAPMTAETISQKYGAATVVVYMSWGLYDPVSGNRVYQMMFQDSQGNTFPVYIKMPNGKVVRWLTTESSVSGVDNNPVGQIGRGSGFVVTPQGVIVTNKHVAAGWMVAYDSDIDPKAGVVLPLDDNFRPIVDKKGRPAFQNVDNDAANDLESWVPASGGVIFDDNARPIQSRDSFDGHNTDLEVLFPGQQNKIQAHFISFSNVADVALIKIDAISNLPTVSLAVDDTVKIGQPITVLGYPGITPDTIFSVTSDEAGQVQKVTESLPTETVTTGVISALGQSATETNGAVVQGALGEVYQLSDNSTGHGNSGGPVFDDQGRVVGIFTYGSGNQQGTSVTWAVPIHFARDLLSPVTMN